MSNFEHSKKINFKTDIEYAANGIVSKRVLEKPPVTSVCLPSTKDSS